MVDDMRRRRKRKTKMMEKEGEEKGTNEVEMLKERRRK